MSNCRIWNAEETVRVGPILSLPYGRERWANNLASWNVRTNRANAPAPTALCQVITFAGRLLTDGLGAATEFWRQQKGNLHG